MKCETCAHFKACKRLIDERYEELVPCEEYQSVYTVDAAPMGHSCWDYPTVIKGHEIPVPHCRRCGTHNTDKSKYCPECGACMDGNKATGYTPEECAAAFEELAACRAAEPELSVEDIAYAYLQLCEKDCAGDCTTGMPPCRFYNPPDVGLFGEPLPFGCELEDYCEYRSEAALKEQEG